MGAPINNSFRNLYEDGNLIVSNNPFASTPKPFDINATERAEKAKKDFKKNREGKKDKNEKDSEEEKDKPLPRPMGL